MKSKLLISFLAFIFIVGCYQNKEEILNRMTFEVSKDEITDSLKVAIDFLDQMDYGNGAFCYILNGEICHSKKEKGSTNIKIPLDPSAFPLIEPFSLVSSKRLYQLMLFLNSNGIHSIGKNGYDKNYVFQYKQVEFNPTNDFNLSRSIIYLKTGDDVYSNNSNVVLDRYKNLILVAPVGYNESKLLMDSTSIMKRRDDLLKESGELLRKQEEYTEKVKKYNEVVKKQE